MFRKCFDLPLGQRIRVCVCWSCAMEIDLKSLEDAVLSFYQSDTKKKESTHEYLMQMQDSPMAWQFAWDLMLPQKVRLGQPIAYTL